MTATEPIPGGSPLSDRLNAVCDEHEITVARAHLKALQDWDVMIVADDSHSMTMRVANSVSTRWQLLKELVSMYVRIQTCFDRSSTVHFLNRQSRVDERLDVDEVMDIFQDPPYGSTTTVATLREVLTAVEAREPDARPLLVLVALDGEPDEGPAAVPVLLTDAARKLNGRVRFHFLPFTDDERDVGWLGHFQQGAGFADKAIVVIDDIDTQRANKMRLGGRFSFGEWCAEGMLTGISGAYDADLKRRRQGAGGACCCTLM